MTTLNNVQTFFLNRLEHESSQSNRLHPIQGMSASNRYSANLLDQHHLTNPFLYCQSCAIHCAFYIKLENSQLTSLISWFYLFFFHAKKISVLDMPSYGLEAARLQR